MKKFFKPIVLAIIASSLAVVSCDQVKRDEVDGIKNELVALKEKVASGEVDVKAQIATLQNLLTAYKQEVDPKLKELQTQLNSQYVELSAADARLRNALDEAQASLTAKINKNSSDIEATNKDLQAAIAEYKKLVAAAVADFEAAMEEFKKEQADVDAGQDAAIVAMLAQFEIYKSAIDKSIEELQATAVALGVALGVVEGDLTELEGDVDALKKKVDANYAAALAYTDALKATVKATTDALAERIAANEAAIKKLNEETIPGLEDVIEALQTSIEGLEGNVAALEEKKLDKATYNEFISEFMAWAVKVETNFTTINGSITTINGSIKTINETIAMLQNADASIRNQIQEINSTVARLDGNADVPGSVKNQIKALHEDILSHLNTLKTQIEGQIETLQGDVAKLQKAVEDINKDIVIIKGKITATEAEIVTINGKITSINSQIAALEGKVGANEADIKQLKQAKIDLETQLATLNDDLTALIKTLDSRITALETVAADLKTDMEKAKADIAIINGDADTEGSIKHAIADLDAEVKAQLEILKGKIEKNAEEIGKLKEEIGKLQQRIQSLVFVPQYTDLKFGIPFTLIGTDTYKAYNPDGGFAVVYKVAPAHLAKPLADAVNEAIKEGVAPVFTFDIESNLKTRATDTEPKLLFKGASGDEETGKMTFYLEHRNFDPTSGNLNKYAISLRADNDDYKVHVASEFVQAAIHKISTIEVDYDHIYKPNVTTGEVDPTSVIAKDALKNLDIEYTDGASHVSIFDGYEMAGTADGKKRTFSQFKAMGYDMPEVKVNVTKYEGDCASIEANIDGSASTFSVKIKDGDNDNMKVTKTHIGQNKKYSFGFTDGVNTVTAKLQVAIAKHTGAFQIKVPYTMTWTYSLDAPVDHANKNLEPSAFTGKYSRQSEVAPSTVDNFVVKPTLTVGSEDLELDGSNKVFGLTVKDFVGKAFEPSVLKPFSDNITYNFNVIKCNDAAEKNTLSLSLFSISEARMGETYACTGTYNLNDFSTEGVTAAVTITTVDRKTDVIKITAPAKEGVKILGDDEYNTTTKAYTITSANFASDLMKAYVSQGIFDSNYSPDAAFCLEFQKDNIKYPEQPVLGTKFVVYSDAGGAGSGGEVFKIMSKEELLTSSVLHQIASGSDCEEKEWALEIETYVGQKVQITWPISVVPKYDYRFVTTGSDTFQVETEWVGGPSAITEAKTELDLVKANDNIQVMYNDGTTDKYVEYVDYVKDRVKLVPWFSLVKDYTGVKMEDTGTDLPCLSNVKYYGQATSVGVKSALYVMSDDTKFYVPGSDKVYVGETPVTSVTIKQANPIAVVQADPTQATSITDGGAASLVYITMKDANSYSLYANGKSQANQFPYKDGGKTIKEIFKPIFFSIYSVNGNTSTTGWALEGAEEGKVDTPNEIRLKTNGVAAGSYNVVIKAQTVWQTYEYKVNVIVQ